MHINAEKAEKAVLVGVDTGEYDCESSIAELAELTRTAGAEVAGYLVQKRESDRSATCIGKGRLEELKEFCEENDIDVIIFDVELTPSQIRNIEDVTDVRVIDRTTLILDIFAARAQSAEGALQVELAQMQYALPRLTGKGVALSRLGGGIGTRGPGETKLETDRRHIRGRIQKLKERLQRVDRHRNELRRNWERQNIITAAIVGYTNAGKSTLLNVLTDAGVLAEDKLFATLDPSARALKLPGGQTVMLIDTVGLIRRLPHHLVEAFKSTLEVAARAGIILNVCDASSPEAELHLEVTKGLLEELGAKDQAVISVLNKSDLLEDTEGLSGYPNTVVISAATGAGLDRLLEMIEKNLPLKSRRVKLMIPFACGSVAAYVRANGLIEAEEYLPEGLTMTAVLTPHLIGQVAEYIL